MIVLKSIEDYINSDPGIIYCRYKLYREGSLFGGCLDLKVFYYPGDRIRERCTFSSLNFALSK